MKQSQRERWIVVIGAGPNQVALIELAQGRGFRVFATDMDPEAEGFQVADAHGVASTKDPGATLEVVSRFAGSNPVEGVVTIAADVGPTVATVAKALGLPGIPVETAVDATVKSRRIRILEAAGVPVPLNIVSSDPDDALKRMKQRGLVFPVVFKPVDGAGAKGVQLVQDEPELRSAAASLSEYSKRDDFVVEEYLVGTEHSIEGVVVDGESRWTAFSDRNYDKKHKYPPFFLEDGDTLPTALSAEDHEKAVQAADAAVKALGIEWGPVKGDILVADDGPRVIEMACRLSGDYFCWETTPLHNGTRLVEYVLDQATGRVPDPALLEPRWDRGVALRYYFPDRPGRVVRIEGVDEVRSMEGVHFFRWEPKWRDIGPGTMLTLPESHADRACCVMTHAPTREEAVRIAEQAIARIRIVTEDPDEGNQEEKSWTRTRSR